MRKAASALMMTLCLLLSGCGGQSMDEVDQLTLDLRGAYLSLGGVTAQLEVEADYEHWRSAFCTSGTLRVLFLFKCVYWCVSALQIRDGYPVVAGERVLMPSCSIPATMIESPPRRTTRCSLRNSVHPNCRCRSTILRQLAALVAVSACR